jgi:DNA-binding LacI/PurR family transcriptional regulator
MLKTDMREKRKTAAMPKRSAKAPASRVPGKRVKIQDVAASTGVSLSTVSAVLNGNGRVGEKTRQRIQRAIERLGYRPDLYASNLARRETRLLGLIVSNLENPFFAETAQAMEQEAMRHGFQVSLMATDFTPERHRAAIESLLKARIAGLAVMTSEHDEQARQLVVKSGVPAVFLDLKMPEANVSTIQVDARGGMRAAVEHLLQLGHRDLLFVRNSQKTGVRPLLSHQQRDQGFAAAIRASKSKGMRTTVIDMEGPGADAGEHAIAAVYGKAHFSAVIAITDSVAMGVYRGLQARKLRIPEDVSVVGFDNVYFSRFLNPPLTTVDVPRSEISRLAIEVLLGTEQARALSLPTTLVIRESTAKYIARL